MPPGHYDSGALRLALCPPGSIGFRLERRLSSSFLQVGVGTLYPSSAPAGEPTLSGAPLSPCFAAESTREGTLMSLPEGIATPGSGEVRVWRGGVVRK